MHRRLLLDKLSRYVPFEAHDRESARRLKEFVEKSALCFERDHFEPGHVTGSAWLVDPDGGSVLLTHHRKLGSWFQLGGHSDGDPDTLRVALREATEESGIEGIVPVSQEIFDIDVHEIPANSREPTHLHFDVRFFCDALRAASSR